MSIHDFPPELLHAIFAWMEHDAPPGPHATFVACSVVSRLWRGVALSYLFSTLKARRRESFVDVIPFLHAHPHIAACVKQLWLQSESVSTPKPEVDHDTVAALLVRLPALVNLSLHSVKFVGPHSPREAMLSGPQPASESPDAQRVLSTDAHTHNGPYRLGLVNLYSCIVPSDPTALFRTLSLCEMDTLRATLNELPGTDSAQVDPAALHRPLRVRWLRIAVQKRPARTTRRPPPLLEGLRRALELGCVRAFDITCNNWDEVAGAGPLLRDAGRSLTTLRLKLFWASGEEDIASERWGALGLSECPQLETFEFSFPPFDSHPSGIACAKIVRLLPVGVRTIVLRLPEMMDDAVSEYPRSPGLREIEEAVLEDRRGRLPELTRVVLSFVDYEEVKFERWSSISSGIMLRLVREGLLYDVEA